MGRELFRPQYEAVVNSDSSSIAVGKAVKLGTNNLEVGVVSAATDLVHGFVAENSIDAGGDGQIYREGGEAVALAGGAITKGAYLKPDASGDLIATSTADDQVVGYALEAASDGELFKFNFTRTKI